MDIDKVAEAIWRAEGFPFAPHTWCITEGTQDKYRRMAQAAIDALQLTQETRYEPTPLQLRLGIAGDEARRVSPWVKVEEAE